MAKKNSSKKVIKKDVPLQFRHGDLFLEKIEGKIPDGGKIREHNRLLDGEVTGHAHRLVEGEFKIWDLDVNAFLEVIKDTTLVHEEHKKIDVPAGNYRVIRQREYDPYQGHRNVQD